MPRRSGKDGTAGLRAGGGEGTATACRQQQPLHQQLVWWGGPWPTATLRVVGGGGCVATRTHEHRLTRTLLTGDAPPGALQAGCSPLRTLTHTEGHGVEGPIGRGTGSRHFGAQPRARARGQDVLAAERDCPALSPTPPFSPVTMDQVMRMRLLVGDVMSYRAPCSSVFPGREQLGSAFIGTKAAKIVLPGVANGDFGEDQMMLTRASFDALTQ